jgi:transposase-like protein
MGLKEILSHIHGQILLLDPMPPINKVFSLILQEERTPKVALVSYLNHNTAAMMITAPQNKSHGYKINFVRNDRPKCTHCHAWRERERGYICN